MNKKTDTWLKWIFAVGVAVNSLITIFDPPGDAWLWIRLVTAAAFLLVIAVYAFLYIKKQTMRSRQPNEERRSDH